MKIVPERDIDTKSLKVSDNKLSVNISEQAGNLLTSTESGLVVTMPETPLATYIAKAGTSTGCTINNGDRGKKLIYQKNTGLGILHLDVTWNDGSVLGGAQHILTLPDNSPTPLSLIEYQFTIGDSVKENSAVCWVSANQRKIYVANLQAGKRYICDIIGFFGDSNG